MNFSKLILLLVLALVLMVGPAIRVEAQDGGQTGQPEPTVVVENTTDWSAVFILISALSGVLAGGGTVFVVMSRANQNVQLKDSTEKLLADSVPQPVIHTMNDVFKGLQQLTQYLAQGFQYPSSVPAPVAAQIRNVAATLDQAAQFGEAVTDGEANIGPAG
ncbi:MAG: hypothetical protein K8L91_08000 [Anaerolineae bacterium]|nr:hypothetical protein [Anaerolineae bacterium]